MAKKNKVLNEPEIAEFVTWALISDLKSHRLAYSINTACQWNLRRLLNLRTNADSGFAIYFYQQNDLLPEFYLIALKEDTRILVKDLKKFDYLVQIRLRDADTKWNAKELLSQIKSIEEVIGVYEIDLNTIKNTNVLFFDKQLDKLEFKKEELKRKRVKNILN